MNGYGKPILRFIFFDDGDIITSSVSCGEVSLPYIEMEPTDSHK